MSDDEPESLTLRYLRRIDEKLDRVQEDVRYLGVRVSGLEAKVAIVQSDIVRLDVRLDSIDQRMSRIERRLDLVEA